MIDDAEELLGYALPPCAPSLIRRRSMSDFRREQAWRAGAKASSEGKPETANSRQKGTVFYDDWWDGWNANQEKINDQ